MCVLVCGGCCLLCVVCWLLLERCLLCVVCIDVVCCVLWTCVVVNSCVMCVRCCGLVLLEVRCFCRFVIIRGSSRCRRSLCVVEYGLLLFDDARCSCSWLLIVVGRTMCVDCCVLLGVCCSLSRVRCALFVVRCWLSVVGCELFDACCCCASCCRVFLCKLVVGICCLRARYCWSWCVFVVGLVLFAVVGAGVGRDVVGACCCACVLFVLFAINDMRLCW